MIANIDLNSPISATAITRAPETQAAKIAPPDQQFAQLPQDRVTVGSVGDLVSAALKQPEVRADKVAAIREAIASGTYQVDPHSIASAMLAEQG